MKYNIDKINNFNKDQKVETQVANFLDENFYSQISCYAHDFQRATELSAQFAGIDLKLNNALIDEKVKNAGSPNQIRDYFCSVEIYQLTRDGKWQEGWFANDNLKTTHYAFLYNFEDDNCKTNKVVMVLFSKKSLKDWISSQVSFETIKDDAKSMRWAKKGVDDVVYYDALNRKIGKLTKSYENAVVYTFKLSDFKFVYNSKIFVICKNKKIKRINFDQLIQLYT